MAESQPQDENIMKFTKLSVKFKSESNNPFEYLPPQYANSVQNLLPHKSRESQIEAVLEVIDRAKRENVPRGLVLDPSKVTAPKPQKIEDMFHVKRILGEGNSAGKVYVVQDTGTQKEYGLKTVSVCHFNKDEIRAWVHLADVQRAPQLYSFKLEDDKVFMTMEILEGETLGKVFDSPGFQQLLCDPHKSEDKKCFSLMLLHGLLENFDLLQKGGYTHGDEHSKNIMISPELKVNLIDFGSAKGICPDDGIDHAARLKADIVNILRQFCHACTGFDFNKQSEANNALGLKTYREFREKMPSIPEDDRKWLFGVISFVMDKVRDPRQEKYADVAEAVGEIEARLPPKQEFEEIRRRLAALLFPERYKSVHHDPNFLHESEMECEEGGNPILDDPELADVATLVDLRAFEDISLI